MKGIVGLLCLLSSLHAGLGITCYSCNNDPNSSGPYDPNCDTDGYDGKVVTNNVLQTCYTNIYDDGSLYRGYDIDGHDDGDCSRSGSDTLCFCTSDKCNNNLCAHCGGNPTDLPPTTPDAPITTPTLTTEEPITTPEVSTDAPSTTNKFTTVEPTDPPTTDPPTTDPPSTPEQTSPQTTTDEVVTTEIETTTEETIETTTLPVHSLACYDCQNREPDYDNYDEDCGVSNYAGNTFTCYNCFSCTVQVHDDGYIFRGEAGVFGDGECAFGIDVDDGGNYKTCYCTSDLCNTNRCQNCVPPQKH